MEVARARTGVGTEFPNDLKDLEERAEQSIVAQKGQGSPTRAGIIGRSGWGTAGSEAVPSAEIDLQQ